MRRAFHRWFRRFAEQQWNYAPEMAVMMADASLRTKDHYYRMFEAGWKARGRADKT